MIHAWDVWTGCCVHCGVSHLVGYSSTCTGVFPPSSAAQPPASPPTAWGLKPIAAAGGCSVCRFSGVNPSTPCWSFDLGLTRQPINGLGPGYNLQAGRVNLCTACAALQPQSLVGPAVAPPYPLPASALGKLQQAQNLMNAGLITAQQYMNVMQTGAFGNFADVLIMDEADGPPPAVPQCDCGAKKTYGAADFTAAHSSWCTVAEGKR